ncbi:MAG: PilN domain-containing protein [Nitrospirae bacterium]|nr:PilN domain-containing protein [Nitrospirota bacterium]
MFPASHALVFVDRNSIRFSVERSMLAGGGIIDECVCEPSESRPLPVAEIMTQELKARKIDRARLYLPLGMAVVQMFEMPPMKRSDAKRAIPFELERYLPISLDSFYWGYRIIEKRRDAMRILAVCVRRSLLDPYLNALISAGITILSAEIAAFRFHCKRRSDAETACLGVNGTDFDFMIFKNGRPVVLRSIERSPMSELVYESLARSISRDIEQHGCSRIAVHGARDGFEPSKLAAILNAAVFRAEEKSPTLSTRRMALPFRRRGSDIDLLPAGFRGKRDYHRMLLSALVVSLMCTYSLQHHEQSRKETTALAEIDRELAELKQTVKRASEGSKEREGAIRSLAVLRPYFAEGNAPFRALQELSRIMPPDTWLASFSMDEKGKVEIDGFSARSSELVGIIAGSGMFSGVEVSGPIMVQEQGEHFSLRMYWKNVEGTVKK